jgi:hypothetical protein
VRIRTTTKEQTNVPIEVFPYFNDQPLASGTAFLYRQEGRTFLVTNWHNVTGRNPMTNTHLSARGGLPNKLTLRVQVATRTPDAGPGTFSINWHWRTVSLYEDETHATPIWLEHPQHGSAVDVVAIELPSGFEDTAHLAANDEVLGEPVRDIHIAGADAFVLGFPLRLYGAGKLPLWKRATVASEPNFDIDGLPKVLIDTATRRGMSGSPVFVQKIGTIIPTRLDIENSPQDFGEVHIGGVALNFLGIYSASVGREPFEAQLGIVWKERAIQEIIAGGRRGTSSFAIPDREVEGGRTAAVQLYDSDNWPLPL